MKKGFDAEKYIAVQSAEILKRVGRFKRLYLEVGGKLCYDNHASRVLPGYRKTTKVELLKELGDVQIVYCVNAKDLVSEREVGMSGLSYEEKVKKDLLDIESFFRKKSVGGKRSEVGGVNVIVVVTMFAGEREAKRFGARLRKKKVKVYFHGEIKNYGKDLAATLRGYAGNDYVDVGGDLVVVTGPAGGSGKMGFCLSQLYYERKKKIDAGFAKFESFPIWNLPMSHPVNLAYEAATADLGDYNVVDKYHLKAYGKRAVNYNRDVENFGILMGIARKVIARNSVPSKLGTKVPVSSGRKRWPCGYRSPTDMGVNMMKVGIVDDLVCRRAAVLEIQRRLRKALKVDRNSLESERLGEILGKV